LTEGGREDLAHIFFRDNSHGWAVGSRGKILFTSSGGRNWTVRPSGTTARLNAITFANEQEGWVVGDKGTLLHSANSGVTWEPVKVDATEELLGLHFPTREQGWIVGARGTVLHTEDAGQSWHLQVVNTFNWLEDVPNLISFLFALFWDRLFRFSWSYFGFDLGMDKKDVLDNWSHYYHFVLKL